MGWLSQDPQCGLMPYSLTPPFGVALIESYRWWGLEALLIIYFFPLCFHRDGMVL